ncbi:anthranilate phosphoribosyltransferase [uncultured Propionibacterium sp.]|uniref:anthranilate phosphoribosyltransferase n=1 Tax=uncultured Propionibacterium sp. TaxID=218066 RepID=UPI00292F6079|nr:anthranilate phosphoribosyltransferase [uncultured Propionibacterium sp.]
MTQLTWPDLITGLINGRDLDDETGAWAMDQLLSGRTSPEQMSGFLVALRSKGETSSELSVLAEGMLAKALPLELPREAVDVVGTGGDRANTVNVSTMAAIVTAASGRPVIKHGNRAASSMCGTAECLGALGVVVDLSPTAEAAVFAEAGIVFLFAQRYHASMRFLGPTRRALGVQTVFNFLGPLANPARPHAQAVGVADERTAPLMAGVLADRCDRGFVFHGADGLDEITTTGPSDVWVLGGGRCERAVLDPAELGLAPATREDLVGGGPEHNAGVVRDVMAGGAGPVRDIVELNAAAAMLAFDGPGFDEPIADQVLPRLEQAREVIDDGRAAALLAKWAASTRTHADD